MANSCEQKCDSSEPSDKDNPVPPLYPVVIGTPETTLDVDSGSTNSEGEEWHKQVALQNGLAIPPASTINVENSSDVVIGPLTQFHGPVTIYQNISSDSPSSQTSSGVECKSDIILNSSATLVAGDASSKSRQPIAKFLSTTSHKWLAIYFLTALIILAAVAATLALTLSKPLNDGFPDYSPTPNEANKVEPSFLGSHKIYSKANWGGRAINGTEPLVHPTEYVIISHTAGRKCKTFNKCAEVMQSIQAFHVSSLKTSDIGYNFLIGGDGNIYVGRGWDAKNFHRNHNIAISFTGNFVYDYLTTDMISALKELLAFGVKMNKLRPDYKLVCHNQTSATLSPGDHVYQEISKFPQFYAGPISI